MRAVLYCRVSTVEQTQNLSLQTQEKACREYATREGYDVADVFVDRGESAKTTQRPEFQRLLTYCRGQKAKVQAVIVYGLSRFSRNSADHHAIAALLRGQGIALRSVTEPIDDSPAGRFMEGICAAMAQFDNDLKSARTKVGMQAATAAGRWCWAAPVGYRPGVRARGEASLVLQDQAADAIRTAFRHLSDGDRSMVDLRAWLAGRGLSNRKGQPLALQTLHRLFRNPVYVGRLVSPGLGVDRPGDWIPLVTEDVWRRAQSRLTGATLPVSRVTSHPDFPLRRFVHCGTCGRPMTGGWSTGRSAKYAYYQCRRRCLSVSKRELEAAFVALLEQMQPAVEFAALVRRDIVAAARSEVDAARAERAQFEVERTRVEGLLRRLDEAFLFEKAIDQATYTARRDELRERQALAALAVNEANLDTVDLEGTLAEAEYVMANAANLWQAPAPTDRKQRLQWLLFPDGLTWNGQKVLNRGSRWTCYELPGGDGGISRWASPAGPMLNQITAWADAWRAYQAAA